MIGRVAFLGSGEFAVPLLEAVAPLADALLVVSRPDRPAGRGLDPRPNPVAALARARGLQLLSPERLRSADAAEALAAFAPDGLLLAAYGQLVPADLLSRFPRPPLNVHPSLLPRHRGAAPVAGAILAGDAETGVTLIVMTPELDAGPIVAQWRLPLAGDEDAPALERRLADVAAQEIPPLLDEWADGLSRRVREQDERLATFTRPMRRDDGRIDWRRSAPEIDRQVRALQPWPGAWTTLNGRRLHVRRARAHAAPRPSAGGHPSTPGELGETGTVVGTGDGLLELTVVQPEGRGPMAAADWRRGLRGAMPRLGDGPSPSP